MQVFHHVQCSLTYLMLTTLSFWFFLTKGQLEPRNEVGFLSPTERPVIKLSIFPLQWQHLSRLDHCRYTYILHNWIKFSNQKAEVLKKTKFHNKLSWIKLVTIGIIKPLFWHVLGLDRHFPHNPRNNNRRKYLNVTLASARSLIK